MLDFIRNRKKPIIGAIAGAIVYLAAKVGFDVEPDVAALIAGTVFTVIVERVYPIFGESVPSPAVIERR